MKDTILQAKPSTLALAGGLPFLVAIASFAIDPLSSGGQTLFAAGLFAGIALILAWAWVVGHALTARLAPKRRRNLNLFRAAVLFVAGYAAAVSFAAGGHGPSTLLLPGSPLTAFALHLVTMAAMVHVLYFVAGSLASVEESTALPGGSAWETVLLMTSIAGFPVIQRRINRVFGVRTAARHPVEQ